jgi:hypothetical protein
MDTIVVGSDRHSLGHGKGRWCGCQHVLNNCLFGISIHGYSVNELVMIYQPQLLSLTGCLVVCYVSNAESSKKEQVNGRQSNFLSFDRES